MESPAGSDGSAPDLSEPHMEEWNRVVEEEWGLTWRGRGEERAKRIWTPTVYMSQQYVKGVHGGQVHAEVNEVLERVYDLMPFRLSYFRRWTRWLMRALVARIINDQHSFQVRMEAMPHCKRLLLEACNVAAIRALVERRVAALNKEVPRAYERLLHQLVVPLGSPPPPLLGPLFRARLDELRSLYDTLHRLLLRVDRYLVAIRFTDLLDFARDPPFFIASLHPNAEEYLFHT